MNTIKLKKYLFIFIIIYISQYNSSAQCISGNCIDGNGTYQYKSGAMYIGDWKDTVPEGKGKYIYKSQDTYDGEWLKGHRNGFGKYVFHNGGSYEGYFKNNYYHGEGKRTYSNGSTYSGNFTNDSLNSIGTINFSNGDKYNGQLFDYKMEGNGVYYFASGDKYEGQFKDNEFDGSGIEYFIKGGKLIGSWSKGKYINGPNGEGGIVIKLTPTSGVYEIPVTINGVLRFDLIFDSGASEVYLDPATVLTLIKTKTIDDNDILEGGLYKTANGEVNKSVRFNIKQLNIGGKIINDIPCAVSTSVNGMNLLGLSALRKLGKIEIDFTKDELHIY